MIREGPGRRYGYAYREEDRSKRLGGGGLGVLDEERGTAGMALISLRIRNGTRASSAVTTPTTHNPLQLLPANSQLAEHALTSADTHLHTQHTHHTHRKAQVVVRKIPVGEVWRY